MNRPPRRQLRGCNGSRGRRSHFRGQRQLLDSHTTLIRELYAKIDDIQDDLDTVCQCLKASGSRALAEVDKRLSARHVSKMIHTACSSTSAIDCIAAFVGIWPLLNLLTTSSSLHSACCEWKSTRCTRRICQTRPSNPQCNVQMTPRGPLARTWRWIFGQPQHNRPKTAIEAVFDLQKALVIIAASSGTLTAWQFAMSSKLIAENLMPKLADLTASEVKPIYMCWGGLPGEDNTLDTVDRFDVRAGTWQVLPPMRARRRNCSIASLRGCVYAVGGVAPADKAEAHEEEQDEAECYDPRIGRWDAIQRPLVFCTHAAAAACAGRLYVLGGLSSGCVLDQVGEYNPECDTWRALEAMPTSRFEIAAASVRGMLYVFGGATIGQGRGYSALCIAESYNVVTGRWSALPSMRRPRYGCAATAVGGRIFVFGGSERYTPLADAEVFDPEFEEWSSIPPMAEGRNRCGAAAVCGKIYVFGGSVKNNRETSAQRTHAGAWCANQVLIYDPVTESWKAPSVKMPRAGSHCIAVAVTC